MSRKDLATITTKLLLQFLTYPREGHPDDAVWIRISDKQTEIPAKLTSIAVATYNKYDREFGSLPKSKAD